MRLPMILPLLLLGLAHAAEPLAPLAGRYRLVPEASDNVRTAVEKGIAKMNFLIRPIARGMLVRRNRVFDHISITPQEGAVRIAFADEIVTQTPLNGAEVTWDSPDQERMRVATTVTPGPVLKRLWHAKDGLREDVFTRGADGLMRLQVTLTSDRLPAPILYRLCYRAE